MSLILSGTDGLSDIDGTAATPAIRGTDANTGIFFGTDIIGFSEGGVEAMRIDASGNVGIGATPGTILDVYKASGNPYLRVYSGTGSVQGYMQAVDSTYVKMGSLSSHDLGLVTGGTERMRIDSSGNVMIGVTSTNYSERLKITFSNTQAIHCNDSASSSSVNYVYFTKGATPTNVGAIYYNGSVMAYQTTSDYRLKENIAPITSALAKIAALKPVTYTWKDNQRDGEGFVAHELQEHFPDAVSGIKDDVDENGNPKYQGMDASILIATLTAAIQEQQALITALTARITALETP